MFSSTTMASSTTKPVATVSAISDRLLRLNFSTYIMPRVPSRDTTTATAGIRVARPLRRKTSTTTTTRTMAISRVRSTSNREARMVWVRSTEILRSTLGGREARICGSSALMRSTVEMMLALGSRITCTTRAGLPLARPRLYEFSDPSRTKATSDSRTGAPSR